MGIKKHIRTLVKCDLNGGCLDNWEKDRFLELILKKQKFGG